MSGMVAFHFAWIVLMLLFLAVASGVAVLAVVLATRRQTTPMQVLHSPDGKYWWDGREWRPVSQQPPPPPAG